MTFGWMSGKTNLAPLVEELQKDQNRVKVAAVASLRQRKY
jgi:hypothetical protein